MKAVILAAGKGSRLKDPFLPKPLTLLENKKSILEWQIEHLLSFIPLQSINIVVGYQQEQIIAKTPLMTHIVNTRFAEENTAKSLWKAVKNLNEDLLWINGDVVFHPSVLSHIIPAEYSSMIVNVGPVGEEEVKYCTDSKLQILKVSKEVKNPEGEALGINLFKAKDLPYLIKNLNKCSDHDYFEKAIQWCIDEGVEVHALPIESSLCAEIDFPEDLEKANIMIRKWDH